MAYTIKFTSKYEGNCRVLSDDVHVVEDLQFV